MKKRIVLFSLIFIFVLIMSLGTFSACADTRITSEVESVTVEQAPSHSYFLVGSPLNIMDATVHVMYKNGFNGSFTLEALAKELTIEGYDNTKKALNQVVKVTYRGVVVEFIIDVVNEEDIITHTFDTNTNAPEQTSFTAIAGKPLSSAVQETAITPTYAGFYFAGWYTSDDEGITLADKVDFASTAYTTDEVFYAKWQVAFNYRVAMYDNQSGTYSIARSHTTYVDIGGSITQSDFNTITSTRLAFTDRTGYSRDYKISSVSVTGFTRQDIISLDSVTYGDYFRNLTVSKDLYCVYIPDMCRIYLNFNGATSSGMGRDVDVTDLPQETTGEHIGSRYIDVEYGDMVDLGEPVKYAEAGSQYYDYHFGGWYTDANFADGTLWDKETGVTSASVVVYARWQWRLFLYAGIEGGYEPSTTLSFADVLYASPIYFDEGESINYTKLPAIPEVVETSSGTKYFPKEKYSSWWSISNKKYSDISSSTFVENADRLSLTAEYTLGELLAPTILSRAAVLYANYYRIPYYITFNTFNEATQDQDIADGILAYYGDKMRSYPNANGTNGLTFYDWYTDKQLQNAVVSGETEVDGTRYGGFSIALSGDKGVIIIDSRTYFVNTEMEEGVSVSYIYDINPDYTYYLAETDTVALHRVGEYDFTHNTFSLNGVEYYYDGTSVYTESDTGVAINGKYYTIKSDFDIAKAGGSSYAISQLYAAYTATVNFRIASEYQGSQSFNNNSANSISVRLEYVSDGVYSADVTTAMPLVPAIEGKDGYWLLGNEQGEVRNDAQNAFNLDHTSVPDFTHIVESDTYSAYYITQQFDVVFVLNAQAEKPDFATVYAENAAVLDASHTDKVTWNENALFYGSELLISEGDIAVGIVEWAIEGWYMDAEFTNVFDFGTAVVQDYTLYAKWARVGTAGLVYSSVGNTVVGFDNAVFLAKYGVGATLIRLVIPAKNGNIAVTRIGENVFRNITTLTTLYVADSVSSIGAEAFRGCSNLINLNSFYRDIELAGSVFDGTAWYAAERTAALTGNGFVVFNGNQLYRYVGAESVVSIDDLSGITIIGFGAFDGYTALTAITISNFVTAIRPYAFSDCTALESITFASIAQNLSLLRANAIGSSAFANLTRLATFSISGVNYQTVDNVLYRMSGGVPVELVLYPTAKTGDILVLPSTITSIAETAFVSDGTNNIALRALVFNSATAPTLSGGMSMLGELPNLTYILVRNNPTYVGGEDYGGVWAAINASPDYADKIKYNDAEIEYVTPDGIALNGEYAATNFVYGSTIQDYRPTNPSATFLGWYIDAALTNVWDNGLADWASVWDITDATGWNSRVWTHTIKLYAKWEIELDFGETYIGKAYVIGGRALDDKYISINVDGIRYYASYTGSTVVFEGASPTGVWQMDAAQSRLTRELLGITTIYTFTNSVISVEAEGISVAVGSVNLKSYLQGIVTLPTNVTDGYSTDWTYADGGVLSMDGGVVKSGTLTLEQAIKTYTVEYRYYDYNRSDYVTYHSTTAEHFAMLPVLPNPTHGAYSVGGRDVVLVFGGWYTDLDTTTNRWQANTQVTSNVVLYARWTIKVNTYYYLNGTDEAPTEGSELYALYNRAMNSPAATIKTGYTYEWHYFEGSVLTPFDFATVITEETSLYAVYTKLVYTVSFVSAYGTTPTTQNVEYGDYAAYVSVDDIVENYAFAGWYTDETYTRAFAFATAEITNNVTLYAYWVNTTTVSLNYTSTGTSTYSVSGRSITDSVVYIPENAYTYNDTYRIYSTVDFGGSPLGNSKFETANYVIYIYDAALEAVTTTNTFYIGVKNAATSAIYSDSALSSAVGTYSYDVAGGDTYATINVRIDLGGGSIATFTYYADMSVATKEVLARLGSRVTSIDAGAFGNNTRITHLIISKNISAIADNAFDGMTNLARFTVLSDGNTYYDINGNQLVNCNGYFASIDGILFALGSARVAYLDGYKVSLAKLVKFPAQTDIENYTLGLWNFDLNGANISINANGPAINQFAFESAVNLQSLYIEATTRPNLGAYAFEGVADTFRIFVNDKDGFIYSSSNPTTWYDWRDYMYPNTVTVTYEHTLTNEELFPSELKDVFATAQNKIYTTPYVDAAGLVWNFGGWCSDAEMINLYDFDTPLTDNLTLYARWILVGTTGLSYTRITHNGEAAYAVAIGSASADEIIITNFYNGLPVRQIAAVAFNATSIASVYIPATVTDIRDTAFANTASLATVTVDSRSTAFAVVDGILYTYDMSELVLYPARLEQTEYTVNNPSTTVIRRGAFFANAFLTKITIESELDSIGYAAFGNAANLERIVFSQHTAPTITADPFYGAPVGMLILVPGALGNQSSVDAYKTAWTGLSPTIRINSIFARTVYLYLMNENAIGGWDLFDALNTNYAEIVAEPHSYPTAQGKVFIGWFDTEYTGGTAWNFTTDILVEDTRLYARWTLATGGNNEVPAYLTYALSGAQLSVALNRSTAGAVELSSIVIASHYNINGTVYSVNTIAEEGFMNMPNLTRVVLPSTMQFVSDSAFKNCVLLTDINLPSGLYSIGDSAFEGCSALERISIPATSGTVSSYVFRNCVNLSTVTFWGDISSIGNNSFEGCVYLRQIDLGDSLATIGNSAFRGCIRLTAISLPSRLVSVGSNAFDGCTELSSVVFEAGTVLSGGFGTEAFRNCSSLATIDLPDGMPAISKLMFYNCGALTSISIPSTVTVIGQQAFFSCGALESVTFEKQEDTANPGSYLPSVLYSIESSAFANCRILDYIELDLVYVNGQVSLGTNVFVGCSALTHMVIYSNFVLSASGSGDTYFLYNAPLANVYVASGLVDGYKLTHSIYRDRIRPIYSTVSYMINATTPYYYVDGAAQEAYVFNNLTDRLLADEYVLSAPNNTTIWWDYEGYTFGGWGYYKNVGDTSLTIWNFATDKVTENGITLYAIWVIAGTPGLSYVLAYDGTIQVGQGNVGNATDLVISNYYLFNGSYLPVTRIGNNLLSGTSVESVTIPETISFIADGAFANCLTLKRFRVNVASTFFRVADDVLYNRNYTKLVSFPSAKGESVSGGINFLIRAEVSNITEYSFDNAKYIMNFTSESPLYTVRDGVLYNVAGNTMIAYPTLRASTEYQLPSGVSAVYSAAFNLSADSVLETITVENGNTTYFARDGILYRRLTSSTAELVRYPVAKAGNAQGKYEIALSIDNGTTYAVTKIGNNAFRYVSTLIAVVVDASQPIELGTNVFDGMGEFYILVPSGREGAYKIAANWSEYQNAVLPIRSTVTFNPNNGDSAVAVDVDTLGKYPLYPYFAPILPYSVSSEWYYLLADGTKMTVVLDDIAHLLYGNVNLYLDWSIESYTDGLSFILDENLGGYIVAKGTAIASDVNDYTVVIPTYYNNRPVVAVAESGFRVTAGDTSMERLNTIVFPSTINRIGYNALTGCTRLLNMVFLSEKAPTIDVGNSNKTSPEILRSLRDDVYNASWQDIAARIPMYFFVRKDYYANYIGNSSWVAVPTKQFEATISFDTDGGEYLSQYKFFRLPQTNSLPDLSGTVAVKEGYTFDGWYYDNGGVHTPYGTDALIVGQAVDRGADSYSLVLYAHYILNEYTVTLNGNGGTIIGDLTYQADYDSTLTAPVAEYEGRVLVGWINGDGEYFDFATDTMPAEDLNLTAVWEYYYVISFDENGGSAVTDGEYQEGDSLPTPIKEGFTFGGWCLSETADNGIGTAYTVMPDLIVPIIGGQPLLTLYAYWI